MTGAGPLRALVAVGMVLAVALVLSGAPAQAERAEAVGVPALLEQPSPVGGGVPLDAEGSGGGPAIVRSPSEEAGRPSNEAGLVVGLLLLGGWLGGGALMFWRAHRRRSRAGPR